MSEEILNNEKLTLNTDSTMPDVFLSVKPSGLAKSFDQGYAVEYGLEEAIMINHFQWLIGESEINGQNYHDGRYWMSSTLADFPLHFPFWTFKQIRRILSSLINKQIIISGCFNEAWSDRTSWYSFRDYQHFAVTHAERRIPRKILTIRTPQSKSAHLPVWAHDICPNGQLTSAQTGNCIIQSSLIREDLREEKIREERKIRKENQEKEKRPESGMPNEDAETAGQEKTPESRSSELGARVADAPLIAKAIAKNSVAPLAKSKKKSEFTSKTFETTQAIIAILVANNVAWKPPTNLNSYLDVVQVMLTTDKITSDNILSVLQWVVEDPFNSGLLYGGKPTIMKYFRSKFSGYSKSIAMGVGKKLRKFSPCSNDSKAIQERAQNSKVII